jgi:hypothetical protein
MRKAIRSLIWSILGVIILLSLCAGMWGMAEIITFINANHEQSANVIPTQTMDWVATVDALSTLAVEHNCSVAIDTAVAGTLNAPGLSPEEIETAISGTLSVLEATAAHFVIITVTPAPPD